jgi:hypothetical protein
MVNKFARAVPRALRREAVLQEPRDVTPLAAARSQALRARASRALRAEPRPA